MRHICLLTPLLLTALVSGCEKSAPPPDKPVISAGEAMRADDRMIAERLAQQKAAVESAYEAERARVERLQFADALDAVGKRAGDAMEESGRVTLLEMAGVIKKLQTAKTDAESLAVNDCTGPLRTALVASIAAAQDAIEQYRREKGIASEATRKKLGDALTQFDEYQQQVSKCR